MAFHLSYDLIPISALLICLENTFWSISRGSRDDNFNFVKFFKKSFTLYVESGTRKNVEAAIDILRDEQGGRTRMVTVTKDFEEKFCKIIVEHFLRKFH